MARASQIYTLNLAANQTQVLLVDGGYYKILSQYGPVAINREGGSVLNPMLAGQGERLDFKRLSVTDVSGASNTVSILVADESFVDDRISGEVSVVDGGKARSISGNALISMAGCGAVAGQYAHVQFRNQSGVSRFFLENYSFTSTSSVVVNVAFWSAPLANTYAAMPNPRSKLAPGALNVRIVNKFDNAASAIPNSGYFGLYSCGGNITTKVELREPIVIPPYNGLCFYVGNAVNTDLWVIAEMTEEFI